MADIERAVDFYSGALGFHREIAAMRRTAKESVREFLIRGGCMTRSGRLAKRNR